MSKKSAALEYHSTGRKGKIEVIATKPCQTAQDLSLAYSPGVAEPCLAIEKNPEDAYRYTAKGNLVAVVSNGTAVLGLGNIGALAGKPVMEGKGVLFKRFADVDVFDIELNSEDPDEIIRAVQLLEPTFGGINLEDIKAPECFYIEEELKKTMNIPVFHDDQHGTAVVVSAALLNACRITGRAFPDVRVVHVGCGAAGTAICSALLDAGVSDLIIFDKDGVLTESPATPPHHRTLAARSNPRGITTLEEALRDADVFIGTARRGSVDPDLLQAMAPQPIVFALSNPEPELLPDEARKDAMLATGRSDMPNQINNALCFPGFFRGALDARATTVTLAMKQAATRAIADIVTDDQRGLGVIIPTMFQARLHQAVARAVSDAWLSEHPDGRKRDQNLLAEPGADFGLPDLPSPIPSDDDGTR